MQSKGISGPRILHLASLVTPLCETTTGGAERFLMSLAAAQAALGLDVTIAALPGSILPPGVKLIAATGERVRGIDIGRDYFAQPLSANEIRELSDGERRSYGALIEDLKTSASRFDIVHNHAYDLLLFEQLPTLDLPIVHTLHMAPILPWISKALRARRTDRSTTFVTCSRRAAAMYLERCGVLSEVIYPPIECLRIDPPQPQREGFIWIGRISPEKGLHIALELAVRQAKQALTVIGAPYDQSYFREQIEPQLHSPLVRYLGALPHAKVLEEMRRAEAMVCPILWEEPFGMAVAEALSCGTPVITFRRGAMPEIVEHGITGLIVDTPEEMLEALPAAVNLNRQCCMQSVRERFLPERCAFEYNRIYAGILS